LSKLFNWLITCKDHMHNKIKKKGIRKIWNMEEKRWEDMIREEKGPSATYIVLGFVFLWFFPLFNIFLFLSYKHKNQHPLYPIYYYVSSFSSFSTFFWKIIWFLVLSFVSFFTKFIKFHFFLNWLSIWQNKF
jgi:hypothetical protein